MKSQVPRVLGNLILALTSTILSLAAVEGSLQLFMPDLAPEPITSEVHQFYRFDPVLGWSPMPGARGVLFRREFSHPVRINSFGMRGPETSLKKPAGIKRIVVLGDSYVWGAGVADQYRFTNLLQDQLRGSEVLNFGVTGYGPVQYYLLTKKAIEFEPDVVVIAFCLVNDFSDAVFWRRYKMYKPYARLDESAKLVIDGYPLPNVQRFGRRADDAVISWLFKHSYFYRLLDERILRVMGWLQEIGQKGPADFAENQSDLFLHPNKASVAMVLNINRQLLKGLVESFQELHIPVIVLAVTSVCEIGECSYVHGRVDGQRRALELILSALPVIYVDPTPAFESGDFFPTDRHWRASGHQKAAAALLPAVKHALEQK